MKKDNKTRDYGSICIVPVLTTHQRKVFTHFPYKLYRNHDYWIAPLKNVEKKQFSIKTNSFLRQNP
ncbi:MAG: hypothetical protein KAI81_00590, partial [Candidatus Marinimicrobia bacterium]|nr:hypothetical protein [Candidatus Neomarinimicrobiota bacterium]